MKRKELCPLPGQQKSFYGKAVVWNLWGGMEVLQSYETVVALSVDGKYYIRGYYSPTTARHIEAFTLGVIKGKKEILATPSGMPSSLTWRGIEKEIGVN